MCSLKWRSEHWKSCKPELSKKTTYNKLDLHTINLHSEHSGPFLTMQFVQLRCIWISLVLRLECKVIRYLSQKHLADFDPVCTVCWQHESFKATSSTLWQTVSINWVPKWSYEILKAVNTYHVIRWPLVHLLGTHDLQHPHRHVTMQEGDPFQQKTPRMIHSLLITSPVLKSKPSEILKNVKSLCCRYIPMTLLFDLSRQPWFDECSSTEHCSWY